MEAPSQPSASATLPDGAVLVVANDITDLVAPRRELSGFTKRVGIAIAMFVLVGGVATGGLFVRRLDRVNASIAKIVDGRHRPRRRRPRPAGDARSSGALTHEH